MAANAFYLAALPLSAQLSLPHVTHSNGEKEKKINNK
jgi:hypothetical protein